MGRDESFGDNPRRVGIAERWWAPRKLVLTEKYEYISKNVIINKLYELLYYYKLEKTSEKSPKTYKRH